MQYDMFGFNGVKFTQITDTDTLLRNSTETMCRFLLKELTAEFRIFSRNDSFTITV
jgi:hypothetical protein